MATFDDYAAQRRMAAQDYADDSYTETSDTLSIGGAVFFWLGVVLLATPLAGIALVLCPIGAILWLFRKPMQRSEEHMKRVAETEGLSAGSGCAFLTAIAIGILVILLAGLVALGCVLTAMQMGGI